MHINVKKLKKTFNNKKQKHVFIWKYKKVLNVFTSVYVCCSLSNCDEWRRTLHQEFATTRSLAVDRFDIISLSTFAEQFVQIFFFRQNSFSFKSGWLIICEILKAIGNILCAFKVGW